MFGPILFLFYANDGCRPLFLVFTLRIRLSFCLIKILFDKIKIYEAYEGVRLLVTLYDRELDKNFKLVKVTTDLKYVLCENMYQPRKKTIFCFVSNGRYK